MNTTPSRHVVIVVNVLSTSPFGQARAMGSALDGGSA